MVLPRYHIENYFLDERVLAASFAEIEQEGSWLRSAEAIKRRLLEIARGVVPYAVALNVTAAMRERVGNVSVMPKGAAECRTAEDLCQLMETKLETELKRVEAGLKQKIFCSNL